MNIYPYISIYINGYLIHIIHICFYQYVRKTIYMDVRRPSSSAGVTHVTNHISQNRYRDKNQRDNQYITPNRFLYDVV